MILALLAVLAAVAGTGALLNTDAFWGSEWLEGDPRDRRQLAVHPGPAACAGRRAIQLAPSGESGVGHGDRPQADRRKRRTGTSLSREPLRHVSMWTSTQRCARKPCPTAESPPPSGVCVRSMRSRRPPGMPAPAIDNPFVSHAFLRALEDSKSVGPRTGWQPHHVVLEDAGGEILAVAPLYAKTHSQGEYVFDHGWAQAYERAGGRYYPKLQVAVPFTPVPGPRLLVRPTADAPALRRGADRRAGGDCAARRCVVPACDVLQRCGHRGAGVGRSDAATRLPVSLGEPGL